MGLVYRVRIHRETSSFAQEQNFFPLVDLTKRRTGNQTIGFSHQILKLSMHQNDLEKVLKPRWLISALPLPSPRVSDLLGLRWGLRIYCFFGCGEHTLRTTALGHLRATRLSFLQGSYKAFGSPLPSENFFCERYFQT